MIVYAVAKIPSEYWKTQKEKVLYAGKTDMLDWGILNFQIAAQTPNLLKMTRTC